MKNSDLKNSEEQHEEQTTFDTDFETITKEDQ